MAIPTTVTQLGAVNLMLSAIGESPVTTITGDVTADVAIALNVLDEINKDVQMRGWYFNTEYSYPITADGSGLITLPSDIIRFIPSRSIASYVAVVRGQRVYDLTNHTYTWSPNVVIKGTIVRYIDFNDLSENFKKYVMLRAARIFESRSLNSEALLKNESVQETQAWSDILQEDADNASYSIYDANALQALNRYPNFTNNIT